MISKISLGLQFVAKCKIDFAFVLEGSIVFFGEDIHLSTIFFKAVRTTSCE
jgi:hypothetical protein